ncbi:MAG: hypothetical protein AB8I80_24275 [Anaerolineae bacterium]
MSASGKVAVVAIGGNSLIADAWHQDVPSQWVACRETCGNLAELVARDWTLIVTHGNGPQVGFILRRNELAAFELHTTPLDLIVADTQGSIGYMITQALGNELRRRGIGRSIASVVTQVLVDRDDPAFYHPSKGIGGFTGEDKAREFERGGWQVVEDAGAGIECQRWACAGAPDAGLSRRLGNPLPRRRSRGEGWRADRRDSRSCQQHARQRFPRASDQVLPRLSDRFRA